MSMVSHDKRPKCSFYQSFTYAFSGIWTGLRQEKNMRFHLFSAIIVFGLACYFSIAKWEWLVILFAIGGMFALELINSAIERVVDLATMELHPLAKQAKDLAAGAVLIYAILAVAAGLIIFLPYFLKIIG